MEHGCYHHYHLFLGIALGIVFSLISRIIKNSSLDCELRAGTISHIIYKFLIIPTSRYLLSIYQVILTF